MAWLEPFLQSPRPLPNLQPYLSHPKGVTLSELALEVSERGAGLILPGVQAEAFAQGLPSGQGPLRQVDGGSIFPDHRLRAALAGVAMAARGEEPEHVVPFYLDRGMEDLPQAHLGALLRQGDLPGAQALLNALVVIEAPQAQAIALGPIMACRALVALASFPAEAFPGQLWQPCIDSLIAAWTPDKPLPIWRAGALALGGLTQVPGSLGVSAAGLLLDLGRECRRGIDAGLPLAPETTLRWQCLGDCLRGLMIGADAHPEVLGKVEALLRDRGVMARFVCDGVLEDGTRGSAIAQWLEAAQGDLPLSLQARSQSALGLLRCSGEGSSTGEAATGRPPMTSAEVGRELEAIERNLEAGAEGEAEGRLDALARAIAEGRALGALPGLLDTQGPSEVLIIALEEGASQRFWAEDITPWQRALGQAEVRSLRRALLALGPLEGELELPRACALAWLGQGDGEALAPIVAQVEAGSGEPETLMALGAAQVLVRKGVNPLIKALEDGDRDTQLAALRGLGLLARGWDPDSRLLEGWPELPGLLLGVANVGDGALAYEAMGALWRIIRQRVGDE